MTRQEDEMEYPGLTPMVKVEVVVDAGDVDFVEQLLVAEGVTGWTAMPGIAGFGHHGRSEGRLLFNERSGPTMLVAVLGPEHLDGVVAGLRAWLEGHRGVLFVSQVLVSRPEYFRPAATV
jgi:PII-like signaling protein